MGFRIRGSEEVLQKLITWVSQGTDKITDYNPGSAIRTLLESVSLQIEEFYYDLKKAVEFAIKNSAYHAFGFYREASKTASGQVVIYFSDPLRRPLVIPKGTEFHTGRLRLKRLYFRSTENIYLPEEVQSATIPVACTIPGSIGNVQAGEIHKLSVGMANISHMNNPEPFTNGEDTESEINREIRFKEYVHTLQRGTAEAVAYGIKQVPGVSGVWIDDSFIGFMHAYVHNSEGDLPPTLKSEVETALLEYRSGGIEVEVRPAVKKVVDIDLDIYYREDVVSQHYDVSVKSLIQAYINTLKVSEDLNMSSLITIINDSFRDVIAYIDVLDMEDVVAYDNELIRAGEIRINEERGLV